MLDRVSRRHVLRTGAICMAATRSGCGTILYPERRGQPAGPFDWRIVALDAVGLLFFFVPGVVAFAVDFATGAIYLPAALEAVLLGESNRSLILVQVPPDQLRVRRVEAVVASHCHRDVQLRSQE